MQIIRTRNMHDVPAYEMSKDSMIKRTKREVGHKTTNLIVKGLLNLFKGGLMRFNQKVTYAKEQLAPPADENIEMNDMHPTNDESLDLDQVIDSL